MVNRALYAASAGESIMLRLAETLEKQGHELSWFVQDAPANETKPRTYTVTPPGREGRLKRLRRLEWDEEVSTCMEDCLRHVRPDLALVWDIHGTLTWSCVDALKAWGVSTWVMVTDDVLLCPQRHSCRNGKPCGQCIDKWMPALLHRCVNGDIYDSACAAMERRYLLQGSLYNIPDGYIAPSAYHRDRLLAAGFTCQPVVNLELPLPEESFTPTRNVRGEFMLYVGTLADCPGLYKLLEATAKCVNELPLVIAGEGPEKEKLRRYAAELGVADRTVFRGRLMARALRTLMAECTCLVVPSHRQEVAPWVLLEAQAIGKPAIVPNLFVMPDRVENGVTGLVYDPTDPYDLYQALDRMAAMTQDAWQAMCDAAAAQARSRYDPDTYAQRVTALATARDGRMD